MLRERTVAICLASIVALSACQTANPNVVERSEAQQIATVEDGTVLSVRPVTIDGSHSGIGSLAGLVIGGVVGSNIGGPRGSAIAGVAGAVAGGVAGNALERTATKESGVELIVQLNGTERRSIIQAAEGELFAAGDPVSVVTKGEKARVIKRTWPLGDRIDR